MCPDNKNEVLFLKLTLGLIVPVQEATDRVSESGTVNQNSRQPEAPGHLCRLSIVARQSSRLICVWLLVCNVILISELGSTVAL